MGSQFGDDGLSGKNKMNPGVGEDRGNPLECCGGKRGKNPIQI